MSNKNRKDKKGVVSGPVNWSKLVPNKHTIYMLNKRFGELRDSRSYYQRVNFVSPTGLLMWFDAMPEYHSKDSQFKFFHTVDELSSTTSHGIMSFETLFTLFVIPTDYVVSWMKRGVDCPMTELNSVRCRLDDGVKILSVSLIRQVELPMPKFKTAKTISFNSLSATEAASQRAISEYMRAAVDVLDNRTTGLEISNDSTTESSSKENEGAIEVPETTVMKSIAGHSEPK